MIVQFSKLLGPQANPAFDGFSKLKRKVKSHSRTFLVILNNTKWDFHSSLNKSLIYARDQHFPYRKIPQLLQLQTEISWTIARDSSLKKSSTIIIHNDARKKHAHVNTADFVCWMRLFSSLAQIGCIDIESRGTIKTCANQSQALNLQLRDPSPPPTRAFIDPQPTAS